MARTGKANTKRMSAEDFEAVRALVPTLPADRVDAARLVLVDGATYQAGADSFGGTRQGVYKTTQALWNAHERYQAAQLAERTASLPDGWERVTLDMPVELIEVFRKKIRAYAAAAAKAQKQHEDTHKKTRLAEDEPG